MADYFRCKFLKQNVHTKRHASLSTYYTGPSTHPYQPSAHGQGNSALDLFTGTSCNSLICAICPPDAPPSVFRAGAFSASACTNCGSDAALLRLRLRSMQHVPSRMRIIPTTPHIDPIAIFAPMGRPESVLWGGEEDAVALGLGSLIVRTVVELGAALEVDEDVTRVVLYCDHTVSERCFMEEPWR